VAAALPGRAHDTPHAKVAIADIEHRFGRFQHEFHGQGLFTDMLGGDQGAHRDAGVDTKTDQHPGDTPIVSPAGGSVGRERLGDVAIGPQTLG